MTRLALLAFSVASIIVVAGCSAETSSDTAAPDADAMPTQESAQTANGRVGTHGMVAFGNEAGDAYLSHIPMFGNRMHDVQLVVRGKLVGTGLPRTLADRQYTFLPKPLSLDALRLGTLRELTGTLFVGNFEDGGRPIANNVRFEVTEVVHQHVLDASAPETDDDDVIEAGDFTVHLLGGAPSKDEIKTKDGKVLSCLEGPDFVASCLSDPR
jgi:hypothetical protein